MPDLREYLGAVDDYLGDDDDILGAAPRSRRRISPGRSPLAVRAARQLAQPMAGVPKPGPRIEPVGFPVVSFTNTSGTAITVTTRPQKPFKGSRLVLDIARTGPTATGLITVAQLLVGSRNVLVNANPIGAGAFAPNAFGVELLMDEAVPGIDLTLELQTSVAPGVGDRIDVSATIMGLTFS